MVAILEPSQITSTPKGNSMDASKAAESSEPAKKNRRGRQLTSTTDQKRELVWATKKERMRDARIQ